MNPLIFARSRGCDRLCTRQQSPYCRDQMLTKPMVYSLFFQQTTITHHTRWSTVLSFFFTSIWRGTASYFSFTSLCSHRSETPVTRAIPAKGIRSNQSVSMSPFGSSDNRCCFGLSTNCLAQLLHKNFGVPTALLPFFTMSMELQ
jgi:hypothetical protein